MNGNEPMEVYYTNTSTGYPSYSLNEGYMGYFDGLSHPHPVNYGYPSLPVQTQVQEPAYWSMNMNSYRSGFYDPGSTSCYGYEVNDAMPRTEIDRRTWEYSSPRHVEEPTVDVQPEENLVTSSDEECPEDHQDSTSSEELLELGETVGTQSRGLSQEHIKLLPTSRYKAAGFFSRKKFKERCVICLVTYKIGDQQITLPCKHVYHSKCGRKWLSINKTCPVCNSQVLGEELKNSN